MQHFSPQQSAIKEEQPYIHVALFSVIAKKTSSRVHLCGRWRVFRTSSRVPGYPVSSMQNDPMQRFHQFKQVGRKQKGGPGFNRRRIDA
jgi:hypothetical protein